MPGKLTGMEPNKYNTAIIYLIYLPLTSQVSTLVPLLGAKDLPHTQ